MGSFPKSKVLRWNWGYIIILSKFVVLVLDSGIAKSLGVLIPEMVTRFNSNYATVGFICSLHCTFAYFSCPVISLVLEKINYRLVALTGAMTAGISMVSCALVNDGVLMGVFLALTGIGIACVYLTSLLILNDYFADRFVLVNALTQYGFTVGAMVLPLVVERTQEAYGFFGSYLILGGITCNIIVCPATLRKTINNQGVERPHHQEQRNCDVPYVGDEKVEDTDGHTDGLAKPTNDTSRQFLTQPTVSHTEDKADCNVLPGSVGLQPNESPTVDETRETVETWKTASSAVYKTRATKPPDGDNSGLTRKELELNQSVSLTLTKIPTKNRQSNTSSSIHTTTPKETEQIIELKWFETVRRLLLLDEKVFLLSIPIFFIYCYVLGSWMLFLVPHAEQLGIPESQAVLLSTTGGIGGVVGKTVFIILMLKNVNEFIVYIAAGTTLSMTFLLDFVGASLFVRKGLAFIQGFCIFICDSICYSLIKSGIRNEINFNQASGLMLFFSGLGFNMAGYGTGYLFDLTHSYTTVFIVIGVVLSIMVVNIIIIMVFLKWRSSDAV